MDWRQRLADYHRAKNDLERAQYIVAVAQLCAADLAERRVARAAQSLREATFHLTDGRPLYEVLWSAPDDL
jgi:hypothetical protein